ncbi:hypothetical protein [Bosea sp. CS1GBMeth4]|uniref:hypothetical protein n=1 Tax=Bosea sp. CS1GBMeth4 TaxID=1892849 RepID=UPI0016483411|nr:hypothetical protein [Bosea sp. CS1GBMeth4]
MSENVDDAAPRILMKIQDDIAAFRRDVTDFRREVADRLDRIETVQKRERRNSAAMLVMVRGTAAVYEDRLTQIEIDRIVKLEDRMAAVEARLR